MTSATMLLRRDFLQYILLLGRLTTLMYSKVPTTCLISFSLKAGMFLFLLMHSAAL